MLTEIAGGADVAWRLHMHLAFASRESSAAILTGAPPSCIQARLSRASMGHLLFCTASYSTSQSITMSARERCSEVFNLPSMATNLMILRARNQQAERKRQRSTQQRTAPAVIVRRR
jgi:hypothetical protein